MKESTQDILILIGLSSFVGASSSYIFSIGYDFELKDYVISFVIMFCLTAFLCKGVSIVVHGE